jgi:hypothetical protein
VTCDASRNLYCEEVEERADHDGSRGLAWMPWRHMAHGGQKLALVLRGRSREHDIAVDFCPFCGGDVSVDRQPWRDAEFAVMEVQP